MNIAAKFTDLPPPETEGEVVRRALALLRELLPKSWSLDQAAAEVVTDVGADKLYVVTAPDGRSATLAIEAKRAVESRDIEGIASQLSKYVAKVGNGQGLVTARYLSPQFRTRLIDRGLSFVDVTSNVHIEMSSPGLHVAHHGTDGDPWRGPGRPRDTLKGAPAAKIVRAIADFSDNWTIRELVRLANVSTGAGYRVVDFLEREELAERTDRGSIVIPRWDRVLRRWSEDYGFVSNSQVSRWIAPRGLDNLTERAAGTEPSKYAFTGTVAAAEWASYAPARAAMVYVRDVEAIAEEWGLRPAEAGANVMLAEPKIDVPFVRSTANSIGIQIAAPAQVAVAS
ncbi:hypothetical protein AB0J83_32635 [Actinoplanes sp. NPDC049596]|uniref:hypothetical protein n=1 Tax=unclassified Actinoplanes TaxID=2626549 RepID=UPI003444B920